MNEKHFIWIVPMLLIIGFIIGYVSGLHIPKDITIGLSKDTLEIMNRSFDIQENNLKSCEEQLKCGENQELKCEYVQGMYWDNSFSLCPNGTSYKSVTCDCAKNTSTPCMTECFVCG